MGIRYSALPGHTTEMSEAMDEALSKKWREIRGIAIASFAVATVSAPEEDEQMIKHLQKKAVYRDPSMAAASLVGAQGEAMVGAAKNTGAFCTECGAKKHLHQIPTALHDVQSGCFFRSDAAPSICTTPQVSLG